jgi:hypothetical protein
MILLLLAIWFCIALRWAVRAPTSLYLVLFTVSYTQGFLLPWLYTSRGVSADLLQPLLLGKDITLLALFLVAAADLSRRGGRTSTAVSFLLVFVAYGWLRASLDWFTGDATTGAVLKYTRELFFPLQALLPAFWLGSTRRTEATELVTRMLRVLIALVLVAFAIHLVLGPSFWFEHANIAEFNISVGKANEEAVAAELGVTGSTISREGFDIFAALGLRVFGTFGEPLAFAHTVAVGVGFLIIGGPPMISRIGRIVGTAILGVGLLASFTRSGWIAAVVIVLYASVRRRRYGLLLALSSVLLVLLFVIPDLQRFLMETLSSTGSNSEDAHGQGVSLLYTQGLFDPRNILGKGIGIRDIPESGYAWLLEQGGFVLLIVFVAFLIHTIRAMGRPGDDETDHERTIRLVAGGIGLAWLVDLHFAEYPFSFTTSILAWTVIGIAYGTRTRAL